MTTRRRRRTTETTRQRAKELRQKQTPAERKLWAKLQGKQLHGLKFRRQHPIDHYIVDFCCVARKLVIEVDGGYHAARVEYDRRRTAYLEGRGYRLIRFTNAQVQRELDAVLVEIARQCGVEWTCDRAPQMTIPGRTMMTRSGRNLSSKSVAVLKLISEGHTYEQILSLHSDLTYFDIFGAAREALDLAEQTHITYQQRLAQIRRVYSRAYENWTDEEDDKLEQLVRSGCHIDDIVTQLQRQPSAIRSRIRRRKLVQDGTLPQ